MKKERDFVEKARVFLTLFIRITLVAALFSTLVTQNWYVLFIVVLALALTFLPFIIEKQYRVDLPAELEMLTVILVYASIFLGEVHDYYLKFWWWDLALHALSGIAVGFVGFMILFIMYKGKKIEARPVTIALFSFCFAAAIGSLWEVFEFAMDQIFGLNMQKSGLLDTMWDLVINHAGALIASAAGYVYIKRGDSFIFNIMMRRFKKNNPDLVKKR